MPYRFISTSWDIVKAVAVTLISWITSIFIYFEPIHTLWIVVGVAWGVNFFMGRWAGVREGEEFSLQKAMNTMREAVIYLLATSLFFFLGERMEDEKFVLNGLNVLTWAFLYYYSTNILKNAHRICPDSEPLAYAYWVMSMAFMRKLPFYQEFKKDIKDYDKVR